MVRPGSEQVGSCHAGGATRDAVARAGQPGAGPGHRAPHGGQGRSPRACPAGYRIDERASGRPGCLMLIPPIGFEPGNPSRVSGDLALAELPVRGRQWCGHRRDRHPGRSSPAGGGPTRPQVSRIHSISRCPPAPHRTRWWCPGRPGHRIQSPVPHAQRSVSRSCWCSGSPSALPSPCRCRMKPLDGPAPAVGEATAVDLQPHRGHRGLRSRPPNRSRRSDQTPGCHPDQLSTHLYVRTRTPRSSPFRVARTGRRR